MSFRVLGIAGAIEHGKDFTAALWLKAHPDGVVMKFADELRKEVARRYGVPVELQQTAEHKATVCAHPDANGRTVGHLLQDVGEEERQKDPHVWAKKLYEAWVDAGRPPVVVPDMRHPNEVRTIYDMGGVPIRVVRPNHPPPPGRNHQHISETALNEIPLLTFVNDGESGTFAAKMAGLFQWDLLDLAFTNYGGKVRLRDDEADFANDNHARTFLDTHMPCTQDNAASDSLLFYSWEDIVRFVHAARPVAYNWVNFDPLIGFYEIGISFVRKGEMTE